MSDYERIEKAILFITQRVDRQPSLNEIANHLNMSPFHFQRLFCRWTGVTPKKYLQVLTVERAKHLLSESRSLLDVSETLGLSSGSRLYDHFINLEAVTPGEYKNTGQNLTIEHAVHNTPFGQVFIAVTARGVCKLSFLTDNETESELNELKKKWPNAVIRKNADSTFEIIQSVFGENRKLNKPLSLYVSGTNFQVNVWKALLEIPPARVASYQQIASAIDRPRAARAVGSALAANPVAFIIPCHRVIQQSGKPGGYHWGETRLHAIHAWESARCE